MSNSLSYVHPEAKIGKDVVIEPFVYIAKDVVVGDGCWLGPNSVIMDGSRIGRKCMIFPGAVISGIPQDLKYSGEETTVEIGDNTTIREFVTINRATKAKAITRIGQNCLIQSYAHVAHDCLLGNNVILGSHAGLAGEVEIDDFAIVSPYSVVHQFVRIGTHAFVQATGKASKDVPPYILAGREPLSYTGINSIGLRRKNFTNEAIYEIQEIYRIIYQRGLNISDAVEFVETNLPATDERDKIILFIRNSKRGIIKGYFDDDK
ncbi:MAG: acyl-ACP--UDP-N-acetylglucosamine O-acyltransferase [Bacteroidales bacterium]|nr:acyl-ACP--UDP-N-acetylglucosamine O-acyltransferase [Bacteroidales bacterium]